MYYRGNTINLCFDPKGFEHHRQTYEPLEFVEYGMDILESEQLTDSVYQFFIDMMAESWEGFAMPRKDLTIGDIGLFYTTGAYIPCVKRVAFSREIDLINDGLPHTICAGNLDRSDPSHEMSAFLVRRVYQHPYTILFPPGVIAKFRLVTMFARGPGDMMVQHSYFGVTNKGHVVAPLMKESGGNAAFWQGFTQGYSSLVVNACADSKHLWLARVEEDIGMRVDLKLLLGLDPEHIKSLFYARQLPVTETGRKRPILHWVRAHRRRIKEGIEIDISKHMRGIETVEMDGLRFEIIQPTKPAVALAQITSFSDK